jgi:ABC-2 type transport system ATP-binding protein
MYDNLRLFAGIQGVKYSDTELIEKLQMVGLPLDRKDPVKNFSMGMKQRLGIAIALINTPEVLVLDEPFSGLDPMGVRDFRNLIESLVENHNHTVLISSHLLAELEYLCDQLVILRQGRVFRAGDMQEMLMHETHMYRITGENLLSANSLSSYKVPIEKNRVILELTPEEANVLLGKLLDEGVLLYGFTALDSIERYFETA